MASSSASSVHKTHHQFDVFLSFRGEDTRKNFVDHLYEALQLQGIQTFKDDERLEKGKRINNELLNSIDDSKFCIIVFSRNYASSSWCLDELVKIMESHKDTAYPVFYDVDPSEVRKQSGAVGEAFARHANEEVAGKWREAMKEAANMSGWDLRKTADGHEAKVIRLIVHRISLELRSNDVDIDEKLVGMEHRMLDFDSCLEIGSNDVRMIGIKGMGGAGKTTLARAIFDRLYVQFEAKSFVENVREVSKATYSGLRSLQEKVLSDVLKGQATAVESVHDGKRMIKMRLCAKKVLLVLDDVDHIEQLEALAGEPNWFKPGSRIIITTRNEQVLIAHKLELIRDVTLLSNEEAIRLLSRHAFGGDIPKPEYETESFEAVRYAAGLPLTVRVLGSSLCGKNKLEWADALKRLKTIPLKETLQKLELSYETLEDDYKEVFLDVACFMKGWHKYNAIGTLEKCGFHARNGLRVLEQRSLITMKRDNSIGMHDHIEELGKNIVRRLHPDEPHEHTRLWIQEEIEDVLANDLGTEATRRVHLELTPEIVLEGLGNMKKLRCLHVNSFGDHATIDEASQYFPNSLRHLSWSSYPHWCLPKTFQANNLVALDMSWSRIIQLWPGGERKVLKKLKYLDLSGSKIRLLDLGQTPNLERLDLSLCLDLVELHVPVGCLIKRLVYLDLSGCRRLKSLSFIKQLESLEILNLENLSLTKFPDIIPGHSNSALLELHFSGNRVERVPSSIGNLRKLVFLHLRDLNSLPRSLCGLQHLQTLDLSGGYIHKLPKDFSKLRSLVKLKLDNCVLLKKLPNTLRDLQCLQHLHVGRTNVKHLPDSIHMLKHLKTLDLSECSHLDHLPEDIGQLESLEELRLSSCNIINIPSSIGMLKHLRWLNLNNCQKLEKLPHELGGLDCLEQFWVGGTHVKHLPDSICNWKHLKILNLCGCSALEYLPEHVGKLESLEELDLSSCNVRYIPSSIGMLKHLEQLNLYECEQLEKLPDELGDLEGLAYLNIEGTRISHLPQSISLLKGLYIDHGFKQDLNPAMDLRKKQRTV